MEGFQRYLLVSGETSRLSREEFLLDRFAWKDALKIKNLSDYDAVILNLEALAIQLEKEQIHSGVTARIFDSVSWRQILRGCGRIILIGDLECIVPGRTERLPNAQAEQLGELIESRKDRRPLDYRRIRRPNEESATSLYGFLDRGTDWSYSLAQVKLSSAFEAFLGKNQTHFFCEAAYYGMTSFATTLAATIQMVCDRGPAVITILPSSGRGYEADDIYVLKEWLDVNSTVPPPEWVSSLALPGQTELENRIAAKQAEWEKLRMEIEGDQSTLEIQKRWYRLLYDDGLGLEDIVKEAFEALGATVEKKSKEKDDYRLTVPGFPAALMEVKGTHNPRFPIGVLRQLSGWIDEAVSTEGVNFKGFFVGNAARKELPAARGPLFEPNGEGFAKIKSFTAVRTMDLYCLRVLSELALLDYKALWSKLFGISGSFDASLYLKQLPARYSIAAK